MKTRSTAPAGRRFAALAWSTAVVAALAAGAQALPPQTEVPDTQTQPFCAIPIDPVPSGITQDFGDTFATEADYRWMHSSTHLQGERTFEKWAWGFYLPPPGSAAGLFAGFRTVVVVDNPDPATIAIVDIEYRSTAGVLLATTAGVVIGPEAFYSEQAAPLQAGGGIGSIRVLANPNYAPIVGATLHHSFTFNGRIDNEPLAPPSARRPGLASMQQLQEVQPASTQLFLGPLPTTSTAAATHTFLLGNLPTFQVVNPTNATNTVSVFMFGALSGLTFGPFTVTMAPFGSFIDLTLLNALYNPTTHAYAAGLPYHDDWLVAVTSQDGRPLLGEGLMLDFYGPGLVPFGRFRIASVMMQSNPALVLYNPELTYTGPPPVNTLMGIANVSGVDIGPVSIQYHNRATNAVVTDTIASFPPGATRRIAPGEPGIVNYPVGVFDWPVRIRACKKGLIGWTAREVEPSGISGFQQFRKVYGEALDGANRTEPGASFQVFTLGAFYRRKVSPLDRCGYPTDNPPWWPSYTNFTNFSVANIGPYFYRFFDRGGNEDTVFGPQPFAGVRFADASFTFEDGPTNRLCSPFFPLTREQSGRVDHTSGSVRGIDAVGDPLYEWALGYPNPPPVYQGPGDVVPYHPVEHPVEYPMEP
jgi:hypothetical protein